VNKWLHAWGGLIGSILISLLIWVVTHQPPNIVIAGGSQQSLVGTSTASANSTHLPPYWRERLLAVIGAPRTKQNLRFLYAWRVSEGGTAKWNPLNTTYVLPYGESWSYNSSTVQNYWRPTGGVNATALTLIQDTYACLVGAFQVGKLTAEQINTKCATTIKTWGTSPTTIAKVLQTTP
jgi:hypothetical protein